MRMKARSFSWSVRINIVLGSPYFRAAKPWTTAHSLNFSKIFTENHPKMAGWFFYFVLWNIFKTA